MLMYYKVPYCVWKGVPAHAYPHIHSSIMKFLGLLAVLLCAFDSSNAMRVLVTGAGGRTGSLVLQKLMQRPKQVASAVGLVRSDASAKKLRKKLGEPEVVVGDALNPQTLEGAMKGVDSVILCSSAVPKIIFLSLLNCLLNPIRKLFRMTPAKPQFKWGPNGKPELVDWIGAKNTIDAAKAAGVKHFVFLSSMGGSQPENFLNTIGKQADGTGGDILLWKRKAEKYLMGAGFDRYSIVHPGGLLDQEGGKREILLDVDDKLLSLKTRSIPRADVAEICVQSLFEPAAFNRSFDLASKGEGEGEISDIPTFLPVALGKVGNCNYDNSHEPK
jgi:uncharacterized protein YbjT (DUF2867 family)